jgi:hypothetical protein
MTISIELPEKLAIYYHRGYETIGGCRPPTAINKKMRRRGAFTKSINFQQKENNDDK